LHWKFSLRGVIELFPSMVNGQLLRESPASAISRGAPNPEVRLWRGKTTKSPSGEDKAVEKCAEKVSREALLSVKQYLEESVMAKSNAGPKTRSE
jgi:hypothetical protein